MTSSRYSKDILVQGILLNKVKNLEWYYYEVDLNLMSLKKARKKLDKILEKIKRENGSLIYKGNDVDTSDLFAMISEYLNKRPELSLTILKRIFDTDAIENNSGAHTGLMGYFNKKETSRRNKDYTKIRKKLHPYVRDKKEWIILAEGDSWFQFPRILGIRLTKDIVQHLRCNKRILIRSLAAAGDWLSNILHAMTYIEEMPKMKPDALLVSGGGNDLVDSDKIAIMVDEKAEIIRSHAVTKNLEGLYDLRKDATNLVEHDYKKGSTFILPEFLHFLNLIFIQFYLFHNNLSTVDKYKDMLIVTHGYDFCIPRMKTRGRGLFQWIWEQFMAGGKWLTLPMAMKGIANLEDQRKVVYFMIFEFNELMIQLASHFDNVYHLDCRDIAKSQEDWLDELHLNSAGFKKIADVILDLLDDKENLRNNSVICISSES